MTSTWKWQVFSSEFFFSSFDGQADQNMTKKMNFVRRDLSLDAKMQDLREVPSLKFSQECIDLVFSKSNKVSKTYQKDI